MIRYPTKEFKVWKINIQTQIMTQWPKGMKLKILYPWPTIVQFEVQYTPGDKIKRDLPGIIDALWHCFESKNGGLIVDDDAQFKHSSGWTELPINRENPKLEIWFRPIG